MEKAVSDADDYFPRSVINRQQYQSGLFLGSLPEYLRSPIGGPLPPHQSRVYEDFSSPWRVGGPTSGGGSGTGAPTASSGGAGGPSGGASSSSPSSSPSTPSRTPPRESGALDGSGIAPGGVPSSPSRSASAPPSRPSEVGPSDVPSDGSTPSAGPSAGQHPPSESSSLYPPPHGAGPHAARSPPLSPSNFRGGRSPQTSPFSSNPAAPSSLPLPPPPLGAPGYSPPFPPSSQGGDGQHEQHDQHQDQGDQGDQGGDNAPANNFSLPSLSQQSGEGSPSLSSSLSSSFPSSSTLSPPYAGGQAPESSSYFSAPSFSGDNSQQQPTPYLPSDKKEGEEEERKQGVEQEAEGVVVLLGEMFSLMNKVEDAVIDVLDREEEQGGESGGEEQGGRLRALPRDHMIFSLVHEIVGVVQKTTFPSPRDEVSSAFALKLYQNLFEIREKLLLEVYMLLLCSVHRLSPLFVSRVLTDSFVGDCGEERRMAGGVVGELVWEGLLFPHEIDGPLSAFISGGSEEGVELGLGLVGLLLGEKEGEEEAKRVVGGGDPLSPYNLTITTGVVKRMMGEMYGGEKGGRRLAAVKQHQQQVGVGVGGGVHGEDFYETNVREMSLSLFYEWMGVFEKHVPPSGTYPTFRNFSSLQSLVGEREVYLDECNAWFSRFGGVASRFCVPGQEIPVVFLKTCLVAAIEGYYTEAAKVAPGSGGVGVGGGAKEGGEGGSSSSPPFFAFFFSFSFSS